MKALGVVLLVVLIVRFTNSRETINFVKAFIKLFLDQRQPTQPTLLTREEVITSMQRQFPNIPPHLVTRSVDECGRDADQAYEHLIQMQTFARPYRGLAQFDFAGGVSLHGWTQEQYNLLVAKLEKKFPNIPTATIRYAFDRVFCEYNSAKSLLKVWMVEYEDMQTNPKLFTAEPEPEPVSSLINDEEYLRHMKSLFPETIFPPELLQSCIEIAGNNANLAADNVLNIMVQASNYRFLSSYVNYGIYRAQLWGNTLARYQSLIEGLQLAFPAIPVETIKYVFDDRSGNVEASRYILERWRPEFERMRTDDQIFGMSSERYLGAFTVIERKKLLI